MRDDGSRLGGSPATPGALPGPRPRHAGLLDLAECARHFAISEDLLRDLVERGLVRTWAGTHYFDPILVAGTIRAAVRRASR